MYCLNKGKGSITIALLVDKVFKRQVLQKKFKKLGIQISIDIFAIRTNRQCTRYCSISKDKYAIKRNGFNLEWAKEILQLHPPISQLLKTIRKITQDQVSLAVLIAPDWPNQKWFTELKEITRQQICLGKSTQVELMGAKHRNQGWALPPGLIYFFNGSKDGEKLFRQLLQARGLSSNAVDRDISNWLSQWRTHRSGFMLLTGYLKRINQQPEYLLNLEHPQVFMSNYLEDLLKLKFSDNSVMNRRCVLAWLVLIGHTHLEKYIQADDLSQAVRAVMRSAGISKTHSFTSIRAAAITKLIKFNVNSLQVDRFTHHSNIASTIIQYQDKNNNVKAREVLCQIEQEIDNEEDEEQERTLLDQIEHERSIVEQRIQSPVGVLSPGLNHLEFSQPFSGIHITQSQSSIETEDIFQPSLQYSRTPTEVVDDLKAQEDAANAEDVARLLDPFKLYTLGIWRNKSNQLSSRCSITFIIIEEV
ncbi:MAG: hypothetical protein EZS28_016415 [Streblomastix strix]|uniref:Tyr recombinase domain-containing protein n=1 Tax=Streblomastix strix TaxID=222440 RepID=A0A5J4VZF2_9EUKA|nr:MAG: hypothetical protein EZS28_016415 [Streblomastix strix]